MTTECKHLKYKGYSIVFQEIPNEVSLAINISGCPYKCKDCHSKYLWEYDGEYIYKDLQQLIETHLYFITCVCFMGGDQNKKELKELCKIVKKYNLKTCLYTGNNNIDSLYDILDFLDYIKIGEYIDKLGGLSSKQTNQRMYTIENGMIKKDITFMFREKN